MPASAPQPAAAAFSLWAVAAFRQLDLPMEASHHTVLTPEEEANGEHGEIFTRRWVVDLILDLVGYTIDRDLVSLRVLEPACGSGAFLVPLVERLARSAQAHGRTLEESSDALLAVDLLSSNVAISQAKVIETLRSAGARAPVARDLAEAWVRQGDFLLQPPEPSSVDFVVGNPPYLRLEAVPRARSDAYRRACATMGGRADVYVGFYEHGLHALRRGGALGFICADRWMRNAYGASLRALVSSGWAVEALLSLTGVDAFEEEVDAYPAVTVIRRGRQSSGPLVIEGAPDFGPEQAHEVVSLARSAERRHVSTASYRAAHLPSWFEGRAGWPHGSPDQLATVAELEASFPALETPDTGTKVGIGIATGADKVFIVDEPAIVERERLLPLALPRDIANGTVEWSGKHLVNPWDAKGLVDLADWPRMASYLDRHRDLLAARHTARRGRWHKTIDRVIDGLADRPKLYLPDFKDVTFPVLDEGSTYPHHNLYWVTSEAWDMRVLGGLLLSDVANLFIQAYSVRMRGGYLRFQAQYLRRIRLPRLGDVDTASAQALTDAFVARDRAAATAAALPLYGLDKVPS